MKKQNWKLWRSNNNLKQKPHLTPCSGNWSHLMTLLSSLLQTLYSPKLYPASRGLIFAVWAGVLKQPLSTTVQFSIVQAGNSSRDLQAELIVRSVVKGREFGGNKKLRQLWSATQESRNNALNRSRPEKSRFFNLFVQISGRIWTVVDRAYLSHDRSTVCEKNRTRSQK